MRKPTLTLSLILCLVLCIFGFASCQKKDAVGTTAGEQTIAETTAAASSTVAVGSLLNSSVTIAVS